MFLAQPKRSKLPEPTQIPPAFSHTKVCENTTNETEVDEHINQTSTGNTSTNGKNGEQSTKKMKVKKRSSRLFTKPVGLTPSAAEGSVFLDENK